MTAGVRTGRPRRCGRPVSRRLGQARLSSGRLWRRARQIRRAESGQATILLLGVLLAVVAGALVLGAIARGIGVRSDEQRAADLGALAGARAMHDAYAGLFEPPVIAGRPNGAHLARAEYLERGRRAAVATARRNGARHVRVSVPDDDTFAPVRVRVEVRDVIEVGSGERVAVGARAEAELAPPADVALWSAGPGEYRGPLAHRQGKPMRPDVAAAFDRMHAAARRDGVSLIVVSGFRSNAEQAVLFARRPDPKWVARPGHSLHRLGTELDLGPPAAYGWLAANAKRFHFIQRYSWEPWHYGFTLNAGSSSVGFTASTSEHGSDGAASRARSLPSFVPAAYAPALSRAAQRWNVSAGLLAAQLMAESNFNPFARSPAGALGIAQFMPGTARAMGLRDPFDAEASIDAQARLMRDLLRQFGSVPLALAAYNAGPARVAACGCVPPIRETRGYVARILGLLGGAGEAVPGGGLEVRLVT
ncbi:MAG: transglycosylase SLT domain-containing protein [Solirubrobacteraceae bacterium]|nr:transglycosylase SLT domain-containing protein [Solirubrobacteraceae bacterium]